MKPIDRKQVFIILTCLTLMGCTSIYSQDTITSGNPSKDSTIVREADFKANSIQRYEEAYYIIQHRNDVFAQSEITINRETPQATLENFIVSARNEDYLKASQSFNFNLLPESTSKEQIAELAEKLHIAINQNTNINWDKLPDRPDGQSDAGYQTNKAMAGKPRRSIAFGKLYVDGRDVSLRLQRLKYQSESPYWVISANTVENIDALYAAYGPNKMAQRIPDWAWDMTFLNIPIWKFIGLGIALIIAYIFGWFTMFILKRIFGKSQQKWISAMSFRLALPTSLFMGTLIFYLLLDNIISFNGDFANSFYTFLLVVTVAFATWSVMRFMDAFISFIAQNKTEDIYAEENLESRRVLTHLSVGRRMVTFIILLIGAGIILSQFESFKNLGISLFASAGVATIIVGIAAQGTLGNIIAGIQIAVTKPAQIGDLVIFNEKWGHVEDIGFVFMIIKTWDDRRIVMPLKKVISDSFENWSMRGSSQTRSIDIYTDYRINVQKIREKFEELLKQSSRWDGEVEPGIQVIESTEKSIKIRALCSAKDPFTAWDLQCELREKLVAYICKLEDGLGLTTTRVKMEKS